MMLPKIFKRYNLSMVYIWKVLFISNPYSAQKLKELTVDGKIHRQVNTSSIYVSNHNFKHFQSLVDQSINWGVSGGYFTVVNKYLHLHVNIRGIDNHDIVSVPIAVFGYFSHSWVVPLIIIIHQYKYH